MKSILIYLRERADIIVAAVPELKSARDSIAWAASRRA